jgi:hypothetical protein
LRIKDNALVLFESTRYIGDEFIERVRRRPVTTQPRARPIKQIFSIEAVKVLNMPSFAADYNNNIGGVDIGDQLKASLGIKHRVYKGN